jgi:fructose-1,6-bisphosphatase I/sedoheptulose-1,7-bisphosphatase
MAESAALVDFRAPRPARRVDLDEYADSPMVRELDRSGDLGEVVSAVGRAAREIEMRVGAGWLGADRALRERVDRLGEVEDELGDLSHEAVLRHLEPVQAVAGVVLEDLAQPLPFAGSLTRGDYLIAVAPLVGSANVAVNVPAGTIFSVQRLDHPGRPDLVDFLQPGRAQVCAGFVLYGPATVLVLATPGGVVGFTLDRASGTFVRTNPAMRIPEHGREFAIDVSNERFWPDPVRRFVVDALAGRVGTRARDYRVHWAASLVAETYRILTRGGVFLYPADSRANTRAGRLRLLYECNPIAFLVEHAGGAASTGRGRVLDLLPTALHQRIPFIFGSRSEVETVERYHADHPTEGALEFPLFNDRTLFRGR